MPISQANQVDYLFKKIGYGITKTANASVKSPSNETISSPLTIRGDVIWQQSASIPATVPASNSSVVTLYADSVSSAVQTTADATAPTSVSWKTGLTNWIDPSFGSTYQVKVYLAATGNTAPQTYGTQIFPDGTGSNDFWLFDYNSGVLNFPDAIPAVITSNPTKVIYIIGARYTGQTGLSTFVGTTTFDTITVNHTGTVGGNLTVGNIITGGNATVTGKTMIGSSASSTRFPNAQAVISTTIVGIQQNESHNIGLVAEGVANSSNSNIYGIGVYGVGYTNGATRSGGVVGEGHVSASADSGSAIGVRGYSRDTHAGGLNVGLYGDAANSSTGNYALVMNNGDILSNFAQTWVLNGALTFNSGGAVTIANTTASTSTSTGALVVAGGVGISGNTFIGGNLTVGNISTATVTLSNIVSASNITVTPGATKVININSNTALGLPFGGNTDRPSNAIAGQIRFNTEIGTIEYYTGTGWAGILNSVSSQDFYGDGTTTVFTLDQISTSEGILVSINGTIQQPGIAYSVINDQITFAEPPLVTDLIDVRYLAAATVANFDEMVIMATGIPVTTANTVIDTFDKNLYRSAKYTISSTATTDAHVAEVHVLHFNGTVILNSFGVLNTGSNTISYSANISGSYINLLAQGTTSSTVRIQRTYFNV